MSDNMEEPTDGMEMLLRDEEQDRERESDDRFFREAEQRDERQRETWAILQELSMREEGEEDREELRKLLRRRKQEDNPDDRTGNAPKRIKEEPAPPPPTRPPPPPPGPLPLFVLVKKVAYDYGALFGYIYVSIPTVYCSHQNQVYSTINRSSMFRIVVLYALILTCFPTPRSNENPKK